METQHPSRRDVLTAAAAMTATGALLPATLAARQGSSNARIDQVLRRAVEAKEVPGVVAIAANDKGAFYEGAFGRRTLDRDVPVTLDTVFRIASMTKAVTSVAAMQLVEEGKLSLEGPLPPIDPALSDPQVLEGFDASGAPRLRPAKRPITLRHLLTHTAGFCYEVWDAHMVRYVKTSGMPPTDSGKVAAYRMPLVFDPGERWEYGISIDWVGRLVEAQSGKPLQDYFREHIFEPLAMKDTAYTTGPEQRSRLASVHNRKPGGGLEPVPLEMPVVPEFHSGGGGLYSTAPDYIAFLQMLLHDGSFNGARILRPETVALMGRNHIGDIEAGVLKTTAPASSNDVDFFPGKSLKWGLGYMINVEAVPGGRGAGSLTWGGLFNTYYWIDPARRIAAVYMTQILPFADHQAVRLLGEFEKAVYGGLPA
jgi:CubicO group peptidase (beta-lactamase class C family)